MSFCSVFTRCSYIFCDLVESRPCSARPFSNSRVSTWLGQNWAKSGCWYVMICASRSFVSRSFLECSFFENG